MSHGAGRQRRAGGDPVTDARDLALDIAAAEMILRLYPAEVPPLHELRTRLAKTPKWDQRRRDYLAAYCALVEGWR